MVQYGGSLPSGGRNQPFRTIRPPKLKLRNVLLLLIAFFVLRNLLMNDYQKEEIKYLRDAGMPEEQMQGYAPKTTFDHEKDQEFKKMKDDIAYLLKEVEKLKAGQTPPNNKTPDSGRGDTLTSMDRMHEEKRRMKEAQLLKEHPDFKPSKRLKDSLTTNQK